MGDDDKNTNSANDLGGKIKEGLGKLTGNEELQADGEKDQTKAKLGKAAENVKDIFKH